MFCQQLGDSIIRDDTYTNTADDETIEREVDYPYESAIKPNQTVNPVSYIEVKSTKVSWPTVEKSEKKKYFH